MRTGRPYVTFGTIVSSTATEPTDPAGVRYEVEILDPVAGPVRYQDVRPAYRTGEDADFAPVDVVPFVEGRRVIVTVDTASNSDQMQIHDEERIAWEECP